MEPSVINHLSGLVATLSSAGPPKIASRWLVRLGKLPNVRASGVCLARGPTESHWASRPGTPKRSGRRSRGRRGALCAPP